VAVKSIVIAVLMGAVLFASVSVGLRMTTTTRRAANDAGDVSSFVAGAIGDPRLDAARFGIPSAQACFT